MAKKRTELRRIPSAVFFVVALIKKSSEMFNILRKRMLYIASRTRFWSTVRYKMVQLVLIISLKDPITEQYK